MGEGVVAGVQAAQALPTLAKLRALVFAVLRDSDQSYIEPWFVDAMLNEAYLDLNARLRLKKVTATGTTSTTGTVAYPADLVEVQNFWVGTAEPGFADDDTFLSYSQRGAVPYGGGGFATTLARVNGTTIETYPAIKSTAYELEYVGRPTEMAVDTDTPTALTKELCQRIVNYARAHGKFAEGEQQEGAAYMAMYEQGLPGSPREMFRRRVGPMSLIPEPSTFDQQDAGWSW